MCNGVLDASVIEEATIADSVDDVKLYSPKTIPAIKEKLENTRLPIRRIKRKQTPIRLASCEVTINAKVHYR